MAEHDPEQRSVGYAFVKYSIILVIVIVVLWFIAQFLLPLITDGAGEGEPQPAPQTWPRVVRELPSQGLSV